MFPYIFIAFTFFFPCLSDAQIKTDILKEVNVLRQKGCTCAGEKMAPAGKVSWNVTLEKSAYIHAKDMLDKRYFSHYDQKGRDIGQRAEDAGYNWRSIGENIAEGQKNVAEVIEDWLNSYEHCTLIMNPKFKEMGVSKVGPVWVQHFGTLRYPNG